MTKLQPAFVERIVNCPHRQLFLEVFLSLCSDFHNRIKSVFKAVLPKGLAHKHFFTFSEPFFNDIMYHRLHSGVVVSTVTSQ